MSIEKTRARKRATARRERMNNPAAWRARKMKHWQTPHGRLVYAAYGAKMRAQKRGIAFTLDDAWLAGVAQITHCPVTGLPFSYDVAETYSNPLAPSIDRIDSDKGYTPENVRVISTWANVAKADLSDAQFRALIFSVVAHSFGANTQAIYGSTTVH